MPTSACAELLISKQTVFLCGTLRLSSSLTLICASGDLSVPPPPSVFCMLCGKAEVMLYIDTFRCERRVTSFLARTCDVVPSPAWGINEVTLLHCCYFFNEQHEQEAFFLRPLHSLNYLTALEVNYLIQVLSF